MQVPRMNRGTHNVDQSSVIIQMKIKIQADKDNDKDKDNDNDDNNDLCFVFQLTKQFVSETEAGLILWVRAHHPVCP